MQVVRKDASEALTWTALIKHSHRLPHWINTNKTGIYRNEGLHGFTNFVIEASSYMDTVMFNL